MIDRIVGHIKEYLAEFNDYYVSLLDSEIPLISDLGQHILKSRGKQLRPALVFLSAEAAGGVTQDTFRAAAIVELLHTAALVHDDIVDFAESRRGLPTINKAWDDGTAILFGDYLLSLCFSLSVESSKQGFSKIVVNVFKDMCKGELIQKERVRDTGTPAETYFEIIHKKTAGLIAACCEIGAISATEDKNIIESLKKFGEYIGTAYQIQDDIIDYEGISETLGKPVLQDLNEKKMTLPLIYSFTQHSEHKDDVLKLIRNGRLSNDDLGFIISFVNNQGGLVYARKLANAFINDAKKQIEFISHTEIKESLNTIADFVGTRQS